MISKKNFNKKINLFFKNHKIFKDRYNDKTKTIKNKIILITRGAGSIGSILAEKILNYKINKLVIIDNNEYSIFRLKQLVKPNLKLDIKLLSILNSKMLEKIFKKYKFDIVYNCAAVKHVDIAEENKEETYRVNVEGNNIIYNLCLKHKVKKYIFISSDKAINPKGIMGKSKLKAERSILKNKKSKLEVKVLRFPNVLGSSGSLVEILYNSINERNTFNLKNKFLKRHFIFKEDTSEFILRATEAKVNRKIILLKNVKEKKIIDLLKFLKKHFALKYKITKLPGFEKIREVYPNNEDKNKFYI